jgi:hypothetical protein
MTIQAACAHPFHYDPPRGEHYELDGDIGYRCPDCGFETVRLLSGALVTKPCPRCSAPFEGVAGAVRELCISCFLVDLRLYITEDRARRNRLRRIHRAYRRRSR